MDKRSLSVFPASTGDAGNVCPPLAGVKGVEGVGESPCVSVPESPKIIQKRPYVYQEINGHRVEVEGRFEVCRLDDVSQSVFRLEFGVKDRASETINTKLETQNSKQVTQDPSPATRHPSHTAAEVVSSQNRNLQSAIQNSPTASQSPPTINHTPSSSTPPSPTPPTSGEAQVVIMAMESPWMVPALHT